LDHSPDLRDTPRSTLHNQNTVFALNHVYPRIDIYRMNAARWGSQSSQPLAPIKSELSSNPKLPATPPFNGSTIVPEGVANMSRPAVSAQLKNQESTSNSPGRGINTRKGNKSAQQIRAMPEHQHYNQEFNSEYVQNNLLQNSAVVINPMSLPPLLQPRPTSPGTSTPHLTENQFTSPQYYQMTPQVVANQRQVVYSQPQGLHMNSGNTTNNAPLNIEHYQYYHHPHSDFPHNNHPYAPHFQNITFFPVNQQHGPSHESNQRQDLESHPQSNEQFH